MYTATRPVFPCGSNFVLDTIHDDAVKNPKYAK